MRRPTRLAHDLGGAGIAEIEQRLDRLLRHRLPEDEFVGRLRSALHGWSLATWAAAEVEGASAPAAGELERGLQLAQRPVFVCGPARSGTTLLRDLLDGHPELVVIPCESAFYTGVDRALMGLGPDRDRAYLACRWLERLVDPPPFWLLGAPGCGRSPYVAFARGLAGWWQVPGQRPEARISSWPLAALALAYAQRLGAGRIPSEARMWVEKSPGSERCLAQIWQDFPAAKVIQIVRRPADVLASIKTLCAGRWGRRRTLAHVVGQMLPSFAIAARSEGRLGEDRYCLVRYEDLAADREETMARVARFLGIAPTRSLLQPTVAGRPAASNTSFPASRPPLREVLDPVDRVLLAVTVGRAAAKLGYAPGVPATSGRGVIGDRRAPVRSA